MSGQHWIDRFFRKRLEHRMFPVEEGEFEDVRALLQQRNGTMEMFRGRGFSKWWLSALVPMAGLFLGVFGGSVYRSGNRVVPTAEYHQVQTRDGAEEKDKGVNSNTAQAQLDQSLAVAGTAPNAHELSAIDQGTHIPPVNDVAVHARGQCTTAIHVDDAERTSRSSQKEVRVKVDPRKQAVDPDGTLRSDIDGERSLHGEQTSDEAEPGHEDNRRDRHQPGSQQSIRTPMRSDQAPMEVRIDGHSDASSVEVTELLPVRNKMDVVTFVQPRWLTPNAIGALRPIQNNMEPFKDHPLGELHLFGAPLAVRTRSSNGERSDAEMGSLFGLDYRVRAKRFSWATGIHYGSYALKGDHGATDVKLNFVEVPLLASYQLTRRRFGVSLQGGLSMDLLFNSRGTYQVEGARSGAAFPDGAFQTVNCSWLLRPQATYHVADHLSVNAGPLWKAQIGEVANAGPLGGAKVSSSGFSIGITWRLERSTF